MPVAVHPSVIGPMPHMQKHGQATTERNMGLTDEGQVATVPGLPSIRMIDPSGHVVYLPMRTCRNQKDAEDPKRYEVYIKDRKLRQGWLMYEEPPYGMEKSEWQGPPCKVVCGAKCEEFGCTDKGHCNPRTCLGHGKRAEAITRRRTKAAKFSEQYGRAWAVQDEAATTKSIEAMTAALQGALNAVNAKPEKAKTNG